MSCSSCSCPPPVLGSGQQLPPGDAGQPEGAVAVVAHAPGLSWPLSLVLRAVLAPSDLTAVFSVAGALPRRSRTVLRAETLIHDGTALVLYAVAVGVAVGELDVGPLGVAWRLLASYAGGSASGWPPRPPSSWSGNA